MNQLNCPQRGLFRISNGFLSTCMLGVLLVAPLSGCEGLQRRRVELKQASGADSTLDQRFELTDDAQDPSERDKELGYGLWKQKPEPEGTSSPTDPTRRKPFR